MNLGWLAAVLQPQDIAPHPNFRDDVYDASGPARLAAVVLGDGWRLHRVAELRGEPDKDDVIDLAAQCLHYGTVAVGVASLAHRLMDSGTGDQAQAAALTLIVCSAAAELDDYETCFQVLDSYLRRTVRIDEADESILQAAVLQQKVLRLRDAGRPYLSEAIEAAKNLSTIDIDRCSRFLTTPGVSWSSRATISQIRESLLDAAVSLVPMDETTQLEDAGLPTWQERVRGSSPSVIVHAAERSADTFGDYLEKVFASQFGSRARSIGNTTPPDLFLSTLGLELVGHSAVYRARKELGMLRLVQAEHEQSGMADSLRLLRHAMARNELDLALNHIRAAGPLSALSDDARQIIRARTAPKLLRTLEIRVLNFAADLLAPAEAREALDAVLDSLAAGGPSDLPGQWQIQVLRQEVAWAAAASLGNVCGAASEVAELLLNVAVQAPQDDQLLDRSLLRAIAEIDWAQVSERQIDRWVRFIGADGGKLPGTTEMFSSRLKRPTPSVTSHSSFDTLAVRLNNAINGHSADFSVEDEDISAIRQALENIRADAARGHFSFGGISVADLATGIVLFGHQTRLWDDLTDFLLDSGVSREDRAPAFERLAFSRESLPEQVRTRFRNQAGQLLSSGPRGLLEPPINPYPAALRFLSTHRLIDDAESYDSITALSGNGNPEYRREAAATVAVLAEMVPQGDLLALALPLARDNDVEVRANAARALAFLTRPQHVLGAVAGRRLIQLLAEDGILVPLRVLRALANMPEGLPDAVQGAVSSLAESHPARSIRVEARRLEFPRDR